MICFIIGASGSGKTACMEPLKELLTDYDIYDFDDIGVPEDADKKWRQESTDTWIKQLADQNTPMNSCLLGQMVPGEILASPSAYKLKDFNFILLDCNDAVRIQRLKKRATYGLNQDSLNWAAWLRMHCTDPGWEQHVIKQDSSTIMRFDEWDSLKSWNEKTSIKLIDTSQYSIEEVASRIADHINSDSIQVMKNINETPITFSKANENDLEAIIALLADDPLGVSREDYVSPIPDSYRYAFNIIHADPNAQLIVAKHNDTIIGIAQINFIQYLTYQGGIRAQIEGVRIHKDYRSKGIGKLLFEYLISLAKERGCHLVQLTTDKSRPAALEFYESLGFKQSHIGLKLHLNEIGGPEND